MRPPARGFGAEIGGKTATATVPWGANFHVVGKCDPQKLSYPGAWQNQRGTIAQLAAHIGKGHPWMPALLDGNQKRWQSNANHAELLGADFDTGLTIEQALSHPFVQQHCCLLIESASSTPEQNKFRAVFRLAAPLESYQEIRLCNQYLAEQFDNLSDPACKDASRFFFGAPGREPILLNESSVLPANFLEQAKQWREAQEAKAKAEAEAALAHRRQYANQSPTDLLELAELALSIGAPVRSPGCGNYGQCVAIAAALKNEFGDAVAIALLEKYIPPHAGSKDGWNPEQVVRNLGKSSQPGRPATIGKVFWICQQNGFQFPKSGGWKGPSEPSWYWGLIAQQQEQERCDRAEAEYHDDLNLIEKLFRLGKPKKRQQQERVQSIESTVETLLFSSQEQQNQLIAEATQKGWKHIVVVSDAGAGKSHQAGLITPESLGVNKLFYLANESRNPSTPTVEKYFAEMPIRNMGMNGTKPVPFDRAIPTDGNCKFAALFVKLGDLGYASGEESKSHPVCRSCPHNVPRAGETTPECAAHCGAGYGFRKERRDTFQSDRIRLNPQSAPESFDSSSAAIWEEIGALMQPKRIGASAAEIDTEWGVMEEANPEVYQALKEVRSATRSAIANPERWGTTTEQLRQQFKPIDNAAEILESLRPILKQDIADLFGTRRPSLSDRAKEVKAKAKRFERTFSKAAKLNQEIQVMAAGKLTAKRSVKLAAKQAQLERERLQLENLSSHFQESEELAAAKTDRRRKVDVEAIVSNARSQKLWDLLAVLLGVQPGAIRCHKGKIEITLPDERISKLTRSAKVNIYLDATIHPEILAANLGIDPSELLVIKLDQPKPNNLTNIQISGFGKCRRDRAESTNERLRKLHEGIRADAVQRLGTDKFEMAIADHKGVDFDAEIRHLSNSRGSNKIEGKQVFIVHGLPKPNMGAVQDKYKYLPRKPFTFEQYYQEACDAEIIQEAGRQRAHRYPDRFLIYWVTEEPLPVEAEQVQAGDLTIEAAKPGERIWRQVEGIVKRVLREQGKCPSQKSVAEELGISDSWLSSIAERFAGGWRNFKRLALSLLNQVAAPETEPTETESKAIEQVTETLAYRGAAFVEALGHAVAPIGWDGWVKVVSRLSREIRLEILFRLIEPFAREAGAA